MAVGSVDRTLNCPDFIFIGLFDDLVSGGTPEAVVVTHHKFKRDFAFQITTLGVGIFDRHLAAFEHHFSQFFLVAEPSRGDGNGMLDRSDEAHLDAYSALFHGLPVQKATKGPVMGERTAHTIWRMLSRLTQPVFLWNVFPLHPHEPDDPMTNRCHTAQERDTCANFLHAVIDILKPDQVLAIGGDAHKAVANMGIDSVQVRHPSYGGQNVFIRQIEEAYALPAETQPDLFTQPAA